MEPVLLEAPVRWWKCPSCGFEDRTQRSDIHSQFHDCPALNGMNVPLSEVSSLDDKIQSRHLVVDREDRPEVAAVRLERKDGSNDCHVFAQTAAVKFVYPD